MKGYTKGDTLLGPLVLHDDRVLFYVWVKPPIPDADDIPRSIL